MEQAQIFPRFTTAHYPQYNDRGEVDALVILLLTYEVIDSLFIRTMLNYRLSLLDFNQDHKYKRKVVVDLMTSDNQEVLVGRLTSADIGNTFKPIYVEFDVEEESLDFYKKCKDYGAILEPYNGDDYCPFSIN